MSRFCIFKRFKLVSLFVLVILPCQSYGIKGVVIPTPMVNYILSCNQATDLCNPTVPPEISVFPGGAMLYDFYSVDFFNGASLIQSGTSNVCPINYSSNSYYCIVTDNAGTQQTNTIQMRCVTPLAPSYWSIGSSSATGTVCGGTILYFIPQIWDSYQWYKNGVLIPGAVSPQINITQSGTYNCFVSNTCGSDSADAGKTIVVDPVIPAPPPISVTPGNSLCVGQTVTLVAPYVPGATYTWYRYYNNGFTQTFSTGINQDTVSWPSFDSQSNYSMRYSVRINNTGCGSKYSQQVTVLWSQAINASFTTSGPAQFCPGGNVTLAATSAPGWNYQWQKNNVNISGAVSNSYTANASGVYKVNISNANGCTNSFSKTVSATGPDAFTYATGGFCTNTPEYVFTPEGTGFSYQWYKNGSLVPGATNDSLSVTSATNGLFHVIVNSSCGSDTSSDVQFTFSTPPPATISSMGSLSFCPGDSVRLQANNGTNYTFQWSKNGINLAKGDYIEYDVRSTGYYNLEVTNPQGCAAMASGVQVTTYSQPSPVIAANGPVSFCSGNNVLLSTSNTAGASYQWKKSGIVIPGATSSSYTATATGNYKVVKTNAAGCTGTSPVAAVVTVYGLPTANITPQGPTNFCAGDSVQLKTNNNNSYSYIWKKNNVNISGATTNKYEAKTVGSYKVKVTNTNGCTVISNAVSVNVPCRESESHLPLSIHFDAKVFPNPSSEAFSIQLSNCTPGKISLRIYDLTGRLILSSVSQNEKNEINPQLVISENALPFGIYSAFVINGSNQKVLKIIKN